MSEIYTLNEDCFREPVAQKIIGICLATFLAVYFAASIMMGSALNSYLALVETAIILAAHWIHVYFYGRHAAFNRRQARRVVQRWIPGSLAIFTIAYGGAWIWLSSPSIIFFDTTLGTLFIVGLIYALFRKRIRFYVYLCIVREQAERARE